MNGQRKPDAALELSFVRAETERLYSRQGRSAIDPVVLVKYLLVGCLYGIPSERQIEERINDSFFLRWYLGLDLDQQGRTTAPFPGCTAVPTGASPAINTKSKRKPHSRPPRGNCEVLLS